MKRNWFICCLLVVTMLASGIAVAEGQYAGITLYFMSNLGEVQSDAIQAVVAKFEADTGAKVEYDAPGSSYEDLMRTRMATQDLPDLWSTHGWSVARYGEYLRPLNDQAWYDQLSDAIKPLITDSKNGNIYCLPVDMDISGIVYNKTVVEAAGVNVEDLKTWEDFTAACQKVKDAGYTPIHVGGQDSWTIGNIFDWVAPSFLITNEEHNFRAALKDGTFDWNEWEAVGNLLADWTEKGFFNVDALTANYQASTEALAEDRVAFAFYGNYAISTALDFNPDARLGIFPIPAASADDAPTLAGGERIAFGVWKDTKQSEAALALLNYFAIPENMTAVASSENCPAGFVGVPSDTGIITEDLQKYTATCRTFPIFDREYLPSGMWDDLCSTGASILAKEENAVKNSVPILEKSYLTKLAQ